MGIPLWPLNDIQSRQNVRLNLLQHKVWIASHFIDVRCVEVLSRIHISITIQRNSTALLGWIDVALYLLQDIPLPSVAKLRKISCV